MSAAHKSAHGWKAETEIPFDDGTKRCLRIVTMKGSTGVITSRATAVLLTDMGFLWEPFSDFNDTLSATRQRATEKSINAQHSAAMANIADTLAAAKAFYA